MLQKKTINVVEKTIIFIEKKKKTKLINAGINIGIKNSKRTAYKWHQEKPYCSLCFLDFG